MASARKNQEDALAYIDTAEALVSKITDVLNSTSASKSLSMNFSVNPIKFLVQLLKHLRVDRDEIIDFIVNFLSVYVQGIEMGVKALILSSLKNTISCSIDPRIPEQYRKAHAAFDDSNTRQTYGIDINVESIDFIDKLSVSPLSEEGRRMYFGTDSVRNSFQLARAYDMDAFLWFVIHKGKFPNSSKINNINELTTILGGVQSILPTDGTLLSRLDVSYQTNNSSKILQGNTFVYNGGHVVSMCIDSTRGTNEMDVTKDTLVPVSDDWHSVNWYRMKIKDRYNSIVDGYQYDNRDYNKEKPIFNLQYIDQASDNTSNAGLANNKLRFTILPKPLVHIPNLGKGEPPWRFKKMLFNDKGEYDPNGKYTLAENTDSNSMTYLGGVVEILKNGSVNVSNPDIVVKNLIECYPGLTLFEFNYDYLTSFQLFDAKSLLYELFNTMFNINIGINYTQKEGRIREIVRNILESDNSSEVSDCYFTFDNSKYELMLRRAEEKRARQERFGDVTHTVDTFASVDEILNEYNSETQSHNDKSEILRRAINTVCTVVSQGAEDSESIDIEYGILLDLIENLATAIINSVLSPKVIMLLEINDKMMGNDFSNFKPGQEAKEILKKSAEEMMRQFVEIIKGIVTEIRDLIIQQLLKFVMKALEPVVETMESIILREQLEAYADLITDLIRNCPTSVSMFRGTPIDTQLDTVDYADIDLGTNNDSEQPSTNNC